MKKIYSFLLLTLSLNFLQAQTWTGTTGKDWNIAGNWNPASVPAGTGNVIIPGTVASGNWPQFTGNVTINSIDLQPGSQLDVNGFSLTLNGISTGINFIGATLNNSSGVTDILININTGSGGFYTFFSSNIVNDNIVFNITGNNQFVEGYSGPSNQYNGNVTININDVFTALISYLIPSNYAGNLAISRTVAGGTSLFNAGAKIGGNFSYLNAVGTGTGFGNTATKTTIGGTISVNMNFINPGSFEMYQLYNKTDGGSITVQNSAGFVLKNDTLTLNSLSITGYRTGQFGDLFSNKIKGNVTLSDDASYAGGFYTRIRNNEITGNTILTNNGSNPLIEADMAGTGNVYAGNLTLNAAGGPVYLAYAAPLQCNGNVTINRTSAGHTQAFTNGTSILGNFTCSNMAEGTTLLGNETISTTIGGTINISVSNGEPGIFNMLGMTNQTGGGSILVEKAGGCNVRNNSLLLNECSFTANKGATNNYFTGNNFSGNLTLADDPGFSGGFYTYFRSNTISGNTTITVNGTNPFVEADLSGSGNKYLGNLTYTRNAGYIYAGFASFNELNGNLTLQSSEGIVLKNLKFIGSVLSQIEQTGTQPLTIENLAMEKTGVGKLVLNDALSIAGSVAFNGGNINSSFAKELIFLDNATCSGASDISFAHGPVIKIGNEPFIFPVGRMAKYAPIGISAPVAAADAFSAEYFRSSPHISGFDANQKDPSIDHISSTEYWMLDRTTGISNVAVTLSWETGRSGTINHLADLRVARWNGSVWQNEGQGSLTGTNAAGTIQTASVISAFSPFTLASTSENNPLPVHLISFSAISDKEKVTLNWKVENEINLSHYEIERSGNGSNFILIGSVSAKAGIHLNSYIMHDNLPLPGLNYYRLKLIDADGLYKLGPVVIAGFSGENTLTIAPNPAKNIIMIRGAEEYKQIRLTDRTGKTIRLLNAKEGNQFDIFGINKGMYYIILTGNGASKTLKLYVE